MKTINNDGLTLATLAEIVRVIIAPTRVINASRNALGHAIIWAAFSAQADGMRRALAGR